MHSIKKNFIYQLSYELLIILLPIITSPYISRVLGADNLGIYSYTYTVANYFVLFAALGIKNYGNREISRVRDNREKLNETYSGILLLHFIVSGLVLVCYGVYVFFICEKGYRLYFGIQSLYVITAFFDISWLFFGLEKFKITVTRNTIIKLLSVVCIFVFVKDRNDLFKYLLILALGNLIGQGYLWFYVKKYVTFRSVGKDQIFSHLPQLLVLFIPAVAISVYNYMDKIMVGDISGKIQLGYYENAEKIVFIASSVIGSVGTVMLPRMSNITAKGDVATRNRYLYDSMKIVSCISFALAFGIASVSKTFSIVFWGKEFSACAPLLILLAIMLPVKGFANVLRTQYLIPSKLDRAYTISVCVGAVVNLICNLVFISYFRAAGAAIGTIFAELSVCVVQSFYCTKELDVIKYLKASFVYALPGAIMFAVVYLLGKIMRTAFLTLIIQVFVGIAVYSILMILYVYVSKDELYCRYLNLIIKKIKK